MLQHWIKFLIIVCVGLLTQGVAAQEKYKVEIILELSKEAQTESKLYLTSNFNRWNPKENRFEFQATATPGQQRIVLQDVPKGIFEFKVSKGTWQTLECAPNGRLINLREIDVNSDTIITHRVMGWREQFPVSTAPQYLEIIPEVYMPSLERYRTLRVLLPSEYATSDKHYPVWYMHDGQDLFDEATSEGRIGPVEWGVDEVLQRLGDGYIVVGIDHEYEKNIREQEYSFFPAQRRPVAEGKAYLAFIVNTVKPMIDKRYRTQPEARYTGIAGGSLGGLISLYAGLTYPEVFGKIGVFSPSFWQDELQANAYVTTLSRKQKRAIKKQVYYFYAGMRENRKIGQGQTVQMHLDVLRFLALAKNNLPKKTFLQINPQGKHGAWYWKNAFTWMMANENYNHK